MSYSYMEIQGTIENSITHWTAGHRSIVAIKVVDALDNIHFAVAFAAMRLDHFQNRIGAVLFLLKPPSDYDGTELLVKEVLESDGPSACFCPDQILDCLDPTRDIVSLSWRQRCKSLRAWDNDLWADEFLSDVPRLHRHA